MCEVRGLFQSPRSCIERRETYAQLRSLGDDIKSHLRDQSGKEARPLRGTNANPQQGGNGCKLTRVPFVKLVGTVCPREEDSVLREVQQPSHYADPVLTQMSKMNNRWCTDFSGS